MRAAAYSMDTALDAHAVSRLDSMVRLSCTNWRNGIGSPGTLWMCGGLITVSDRIEASARTCQRVHTANPRVAACMRSSAAARVKAP